MEEQIIDNIVAITRNQLYERVWSLPLKILARDFGISDVRLGRICRKHGIPLPGIGYWAKFKSGKEVGRKELPPIVNRSIQSFPIIPEPIINDKRGIKQLEKQASTWNNCQIIRAYLKAVEAEAVKKFGEIEQGSPIDNWLKSCYNYVEPLDPATKLVEWFERDSNPIVRDCEKDVKTLFLAIQKRQKRGVF
ncbi:MAG: hypothetical protein A2Y10_01390 [Planctomycetes bacterium GWF2_41_51]|nr:MAG: hypothetical protein A2Y10_01390 [Planctomycetes bacterium GWF2_41_51]HBG26719.1 hypothetical protein [Phycisphaerales bacterium]